jgi:predicted phosphodiesterase
MSFLKRSRGIFGILLIGLGCDTDFAQPVLTADGPPTMVIYGDSKAKRTFTGTGGPHEAIRRAVIGAIVAERPEYVLHTGDIVDHGDRSIDWEQFADETKPLYREGVRIFPTLGNHDLRGNESRALTLYYRMFPDYKDRRWYKEDVGAVRFIVLDSNFDDLSETERAQQLNFLENQLDESEKATTIQSVLLVAHHPAYTNSQKQEAAAAVREAFDSRARKAKKYHAFIAGHVHSYERFRIGGIQYITTGGGGAELATLPADPAQSPHKDLAVQTGPRGYHYLVFTFHVNRIEGVMKQYREDGEWEVKDTFTIEHDTQRSVPSR